MSEDCWLIYALGGGWGHLTRSLALARVVAQQYPVKVLTNSAYVSNISADEGLLLHRISPKAGLRSTCREVEQVVQELDYACLIIDTFPRGLGGELSVLPRKKRLAPRILIHRDITPKYIESKYLQAFVRTQFDRILIPGEYHSSDHQSAAWELPLATLPQVYHTAPWLIRHAEELPNYETARSILRLTDLPTTVPVVLVLASGRMEELRWFGEVAATLAAHRSDLVVRLVSATCPDNCPEELWVTHWPAIECLIAADLVIGSAGYNTFYECQMLGIPLVARPFWRLYDRQDARVQRWLEGGQMVSPDWSLTAVQDTRTAIAAVERLLQSVARTHDQPMYDNGAIAAVEDIARLL